MAISADLKPFVINATDIQFILDQVNFRPLFRQNGDIIVAWDGTGTVYDINGAALATGGTLPTDQASLDAIALVGASYQNFTDLSGTRDVSGFWNNLTPLLSGYGQTGQIFPRLIDANYGNYLTQSTTGAPASAPAQTDLNAATPSLTLVASYVEGTKTVVTIPVTFPGGSYSYTYETWSRVLTEETQTLYTVDGHHVFVSLNRVDTATSTETDFMVNDANGPHVAIAGPKVSQGTAQGPVTLSGGELDGRYHSFTTSYALAHQDYTVQAALGGGAEGDTTATDGTSINIKSVVDYTPRMISRTITTAGVTYDTWANHQNEPGAPNHQPNEIYYNPSTGEAVVLDWGKLETVANGGEGQIDTQARLSASAGQSDHFIGGLNPGVSPSNGFFVLFGQFFDHGLDFVDKGQLDANGKNLSIKIALAVDDPLYGMLGPDGRPVTEITINRATVQTIDGQGSEYVNHVSPFIDQSQTYGSNGQRTNLLREWVSNDGGSSFHAGMSLLDGHTLGTQWAKADGTLVNDTLPTLNELRQHIEATGRDALTWEDVSDLRNRDAAGHVISGTSGEALLLDMNPRFDAAHLLSGMGESSAQSQKVLAAIATLDADAKAVYGPNVSFGMVGGVLTLTGLTPQPLTGASALYPWVNFSNFSIMSSHPFAAPTDSITSIAHSAVSDILMASVGDHYIAGDGRVNENFGLTSIHHIFHEEHNYQVQNLIDALHRQDIATNDVTHAKLHEFQNDTGHGMNAAGDYLNADGSIAWNEEKVFLGAKLIVEMEYQHAAVDQYARNVSPNIQEFVGYSPDKQPDVTLEYSQVAFRFGHSTLRETIDTIDPSGGITGKIMGYALHDAFLNPEKYGDLGPASIVLGMSHQQMNAVDEFVTPALNQGLLGQPLDLAAINIARGRDIGIPTLNDFREALGFARYTSWTDFSQNMQHPSSLVNFIAAYSFDGNLNKALAIVGLADGSIAEGSDAAMGFTGAQAVAFLSGDAAAGGEGTLGFNAIDTWIGGLAELQVPGGLLGETFDKVFVTQIEALMDGDRFYYLYRLAGQQFGEEVANGQLKDIVERNTGLVHLNGNIFGYADQYVDLAAKKEVVAVGGEAQTTGNEHKYGDLAAVADGSMGIYSNGGLSNLHDGETINIGGHTYVQDTRLSADNPLSAEYNNGNNAYAANGYTNLDGTPNSGAESSEVIVGSKGQDLIYAQGGDDTVYGEDGNDIIYGGYGIDRIYGGGGSDAMYGGDNPDLMDGGSGDDFIYGESSGTDINGADQLIGGSGNDLIDGGVGIDKLSAGSGDDRVYGGQDTDPFTHGGDGNDFVSGDSGGDILYGDNGDDIVVGGADQDQIFGNDGDDILRPGDPTGALTIGSDEVLGGDGVDVNDKGFDLIDFSDNTARPNGVTFDLGNQANPNVTVNGSPLQVPSFQIDGAVGSVSDDTLIGSDPSDAGNGADASIAGTNWLVGGSGNDTLQGRGGNDILVGGSIRLDALIGKYNSGYTHNNNNAGLTDAEQLQDALYQGASHRVLYSETIDNSGLLGHAETSMFDKHFTELLRTEMFKDTVLGDGGTDGAADAAIYTGNLADYKLTALDAQGNVVANPHSNWGSVLAIKIEDLRDPNAVDANGVLIPTDGTDLVIGVEKLKFADQVITPEAFFDVAPTLDLHYVLQTQNQPVASDNFSGAAANAYARGTGWAANWTEANDAAAGNAYSAGQIQVANNSLRFGSGDGASIQRAVDLSGKSSATISFNVNESNFGSNETVKVSFAADGATFVDVGTFNSSTNATYNAAAYSFVVDAPTAGFSATAQLRFTVSTVAAVGGNGAHTLTIDNVTVTTPVTVDQFPGTGYSTSYTEQLAATAIASTPIISDPDDATLASATIHIRDAVAGDILNVGTLPSGITATGAGTTTVTLLGVASHAAYQAALAAITFSNPTNDNPTNAVRHVDVTVNDGLKDSAISTTAVSVTPVNDPTVTGADHIVTNAATFTIADALLVVNDTDPDSTLAISGTNTAVGLTATHSTGTQSITVTDSGAPGGTFNYVVNGVNGAVDVVRQSGSVVNGTALNEIILGTTGNDTLNGGGGDDTLVYTVTTQGQNTVTSGTDTIDGGANNAAGDRFVLNGTTGAETFRIFSNTDDWDNNSANGILSSAAHAGITSAGKIVITRNGTIGANGVLSGATVLAHLTNVEEITINTVAQTSGTPPVTGTAGGDTIQVFGDFTNTGLNYNTITVNDEQGGSTVDISGLSSAHRIVFNTNADGTVVGDVRPQDVINHVFGATPPPSSSGTTDTGSGTGSSSNDGTHECPTDGGQGSHASDSTDTSSPGSSPTPSGAPTTTPTDGVIYADDAAKVVHADASDNIIVGNDHGMVIFAEGGDDVVDGGAGRDIVLAGDGNDTVAAGQGDDLVWGDNGDDLIDGGDGADILFGGAGRDEIHGGAADDRIDGGSGIDVLFGGSGHDGFVFHSAADANGDTIADFEAGDTVNLHGLLSDGTDSHFSILSGQAFTSTGQLIVVSEGDGHALIQGSVTSSDHADFTITVHGDFTLDELKKSLVA